MDFLIGLLVQLALLVGGAKLYLWSRRRARAARSRWRRRMGALLFLFPVALWLAALVLPAALHGPLELLGAANAHLDAGLAWAIGRAEAEVGGVLGLILKPVAYALFYGAAGVLVGWPLDRLRPAVEEKGEEKGKE